jgi:endoglucanase
MHSSVFVATGGDSLIREDQRMASCGAHRCRGAGRATLARIAVALGVIALSASLSLGQESVVAKHGQLSVKGNRIIDKDSNPVTLRGMSLYWSQWKGPFYNPDCIKWLRDDWNCTLVRAAMAVGSGGYLTNPEEEKQKVKTVVQAAIDLGIYVIIDWHVLAEGPKTVEQAGAFFEEMAKTYGSKPNVIYEIWNEPVNTQDWTKVIKPYHEAIIARIRAQDPDNIIVCGTQTWSQDVDKAAVDPLKGTNIAYALHFYAATHKQALRDKAAAALGKDIALMVTEWGTSEASGGGKLDAQETKDWLDFMDKNQLSWCNWSIADLNETSAALKPGASPKGNWSADEISASGQLVRSELKAKSQVAEDELKEIRTPDVIFVPTPIPVVDKMLEMAQVTKDDVLYDLGCGNGAIVVEAAKKIGCRCVGFDIDPQRVKEARANVAQNNVGHLVRIEQKDIFTLDLSPANVITLYLLPSLNVRLIPQLEKLKAGSRIVSHDFDMKGVTPDQHVKVEAKTDSGFGPQHDVYLWTAPLKKEAGQS